MSSRQVAAAHADNAGARCWICGATGLRRIKASDLSGRTLSPEDFAITDRRYGLTAAIDQCPQCSFRQCTDTSDVLGYYAELDDRVYDTGRDQRARQARGLLKVVRRHAQGGSLLDIGAGSGILVGEAAKFGFRAEGVEPSRHLVEQAAGLGLKVHHGALPDPDIAKRRFDAVTIVDVIEHVSDPVGLLKEVRSVLSPQGIGVVVTPDVSSWAARVMGRRWWHYRIAHIGYFNRKTLTTALEKAGLRVVASGRPRWYFSGDYLGERLASYLPIPFSKVSFSWAKPITIPLDLRDSIYLVFART